MNASSELKGIGVPLEEELELVTTVLGQRAGLECPAPQSPAVKAALEQKLPVGENWWD